MAKSARPRKGSKENPIEVDELADALAPVVGRDFVIVEASIKDDFCNYSYDITGGVGIGNTHGVKGQHIVVDDMLDVFRKFNVHLAALDDAFRLSGIEIDRINSFEVHEITLGYKVTGFRIKGASENESIMLIGTKYSDTAKGRLKCDTPYIPIDGLSHYKWYNELKEIADAVREEVALYHEGKYRIAQEEDDANGKATQLTIASPEGAAVNSEYKVSASVGEGFDDFEEARR